MDSSDKKIEKRKEDISHYEVESYFWNYEQMSRTEREYFLQNLGQNPNKRKFLLSVFTINRILFAQHLASAKHLDELKKNYATQFFTLYMTKQIHFTFALFELVKVHKYNPANSLIRTIWETNQLLGAIEENPEEAKKIYSQIREEIIEGDEKVQKKEITLAELALQDHDYVDKVQAFRKKYKVKLEKTDEIHKRVHNYLSNSKVHPAQIDGLNLDDGFHFESEAQLAELMIGFTYGMLRKFHNLFADYLNEDELLELQAIRKQIEEECPDGILSICY